MISRVAFMKAPWQVELRSVELPDTPPPGSALVRVEACGVCGSDLGALEEKAKTWRPFGHEVAGVIEKLGVGCSGLQVGMRVVLESTGYCGLCERCLDGRIELCTNKPRISGAASMGFSDYMFAPAHCIVPYEGIPPEIACLCEPVGVALDMVKTAGIAIGDRVCIIGPGPIGLMAIPVALRSGALSAACIGRADSHGRLRFAEQLGAAVWAMDREWGSQPELRRQFDHVLLTAPARLVPEALELLDYGGILTYIGFGAGSGRIEFDANQFHTRRLQLRAGFASPGIYFPTVLKLLKNGTIPGEKMVTHKAELGGIVEALDRFRTEKDSIIKMVITP
jgi:L-iditol 2-dehydrogenase